MTENEATTKTDALTQPPVKKELRPTSKPKSERIRAELNLEKWPALWMPTHSKTKSKEAPLPRTLERETVAADGTRSSSKVTINPIAHLGDLTTGDQRTLYALIKHWEDRGKPNHETAFSIRQLSRLLHVKGWGTNTIDSITGSLERLRGTMLVWTRSYRSKDQKVEDLETIYINILTKLKIIRRKVDGHITTEAGYFQFDDHILKNLLENYTKPFLFDVFIDIRGETALKLYSYLDLIMADKNRFERCTRELFEDLGLKGISYRSPSKRKQLLDRALAELNGIMLTTGVLKSATIEWTKDKRDYKAVFQKSPRTEFELTDGDPSTKFSTGSPPIVINDYSKRKEPGVVEAEQLVCYFQKVFHDVADHRPQSKERGQAQVLISQYGLDQSKRIVDFAKQEAAKTNFSIQHFGAIINYASRALAAQTRETTPPALKYRPISSHPAAGVAFPRGEQRLAGLMPDQLQARLESAKADLFKEQTFFAKSWKDGSKMHERAIRARMLLTLETEPMDVLIVDGNTDPEAIRRKLGFQNLAH